MAGDELVWLLRRVNEEWGTAVVLAEHRLERCLAAADRVLVVEDGALAHDGDRDAFLRWDLDRGGALSTPVARLFDLAGLARRRRRSSGPAKHCAPCTRGGRSPSRARTAR